MLFLEIRQNNENIIMNYRLRIFWVILESKSQNNPVSTCLLL